MNGIGTFRYVIAGLVIFVWLVAVFVAFFTQNFAEIALLMPAVMLSLGFVFGYKTESIIKYLEKENR